MYPIKFTVTRPSSYQNNNLGRTEEMILEKVEEFMHQFTHIDEEGKLHRSTPDPEAAEEIFLKHDTGINVTFMPTLAAEVEKIRKGILTELPSRFSATSWQLCAYRASKVPTPHTHVFFCRGEFYLLELKREPGSEKMAKAVVTA